MNYFKKTLIENSVGIIIVFVLIWVASALILQESVPILVRLSYVSSGMSHDLQKWSALCLRISASLSYESVMKFNMSGSVRLSISNLCTFKL